MSFTVRRESPHCARVFLTVQSPSQRQLGSHKGINGLTLQSSLDNIEGVYYKGRDDAGAETCETFYN